MSTMSPLPGDELLTTLVGVTGAELNDDEPADLMLRKIVEKYVRAHEQVRQSAAKIVGELQRNIDTDNYQPSLLADCADGRYHDQAVASMRILNELLIVAVHAYKLAHPDA